MVPKKKYFHESRIIKMDTFMKWCVIGCASVCVLYIVYAVCDTFNMRIYFHVGQIVLLPINVSIIVFMKIINKYKYFMLAKWVILWCVVRHSIIRMIALFTSLMNQMLMCMYVCVVFFLSLCISVLNVVSSCN